MKSAWKQIKKLMGFYSVRGKVFAFGILRDLQA